MTLPEIESKLKCMEELQPHTPNDFMLRTIVDGLMVEIELSNNAGKAVWMLSSPMVAGTQYLDSIPEVLKAIEEMAK